MKENTMATNFESHECVIFVQSTKIGSHENEAIHSMYMVTRIGMVVNHRNVRRDVTAWIGWQRTVRCHPALTQQKQAAHYLSLYFRY